MKTVTEGFLSHRKLRFSGLVVSSRNTLDSDTIWRTVTGTADLQRIDIRRIPAVHVWPPLPLSISAFQWLINIWQVSWCHASLFQAGWGTVIPRYIHSPNYARHITTTCTLSRYCNTKVVQHAHHIFF